MRVSHAAAAVACLLTAAAASQSQALVQTSARDTAMSERISAANVDFRDSAAVQAFYKRLQQAANFVCGGADVSDHAARAESQACRAKVLRSAVNAVDRPLLTAAYQSSDSTRFARDAD